MPPPEPPTALEFDHVQLTVPPDTETACKRFYGELLGLREVPKPAALQARGGAWYQLGGYQLHVSLEDLPAAQNAASRRHVCFRTRDLAATEAHLRAAGVVIIADTQPTPGWLRFYARDPGGNRVEFGQVTPGA